MQDTKKSVLVTYPQQQLEDNTQKAFVSPSLNRVEEEEEKNNIGIGNNIGKLFALHANIIKGSMVSVTPKCLFNFLFAKTGSSLSAKTPKSMCFLV